MMDYDRGILIRPRGQGGANGAADLNRHGKWLTGLIYVFAGIQVEGKGASLAPPEAIPYHQLYLMKILWQYTVFLPSLLRCLGNPSLMPCRLLIRAATCRYGHAFLKIAHLSPFSVHWELHHLRLQLSSRLL